MAENVTERITSIVAEKQCQSANERSGIVSVSSCCYYSVPFFSDTAMWHMYFI